MANSEKPTEATRSLGLDLSVEGIAAFCVRWRISELAIFGSVLREDFRPESDVDLLVSFSDTAHWSLTDMVHMQQELQDLIGRPVDLVERKAVELSENYIRRRHILETAEPLYVTR
jgi:uncharacterized protein